MRDARRYNAGFALAPWLAFTALAGTIVGSALDFGLAYPAAAMLVFAAIAGGVLVVEGHRHPYGVFGPANHLTAARAALVSLVAALIGHPAGPGVLWGVVVVATTVAALDGVDGALARRSGVASPFGARFDMETDAAFIMILSVLVWQHDKAGAWVLLCGLMRYAFVAAGWLLPWMAAPLRSTRRGKTVAVAQVVGLCVALAPIVPPPLSDAAAAIVLAALIWSFGVDVLWLSRQ